MRQCPRKPGGSRYSFARIALNVPCFDGRSPTDGENSTSPLIKSGVSNFPLHINIPASRPTLPRRNSTGPENVTEFPSPLVHVASDGWAAPQAAECGSAIAKVPFPSLRASKRRDRCSSLPNVISTFHLPIRFGDCASANMEQHVFTISVRINAHVAFTFLSNRNSVLGNPIWFLTCASQSLRRTRELSRQFPSHRSRITVAAAALVEAAVRGQSLVSGWGAG